MNNHHTSGIFLRFANSVERTEIIAARLMMHKGSSLCNLP